jgi:hypothetical protein
MKGADVESVIIDGKFVMRDRKILNMDEKSLYSKIECVAVKIREKNNLLTLKKPFKDQEL